MSKSRKRSKGTVRAAPIAPEKHWTVTQTAQRIVWSGPPPREGSDWIALVGDFFFWFVLFAALLYIPLLAWCLLDFAISWMRGSAFSFASYYELFLWTLAPTAIMTILSMLDFLIIGRRSTHRVELSLDAETLVLHQSSFPNRIDTLVIPFGAIGYIQPTKANSYDDADLVINYPDDHGDYKDAVLRLQLSDAIMNAHVDWLRPALGERIRNLIVYDR
ncbi:hypothetical protein INH39_21565 [Massilia violaceinigra]|uniref:DUF502 domain-containing protein n=1 Tax=Massilia violaceinigra TaxID=2045208 RepID=A0ABY4A036_9BURK|nr:hypothetical protein [Massilia violaceinigra]UOD28051.1 hypothetical protein INH39_21565 [Massilia violaceinigra]